MSQKTLAQACEVSLGTVNLIATRLERFGAIEKKPFGFRAIDPKKILVYWAGKRNLAKDILYGTRSTLPPPSTEAQLPSGTIFTGYSGYRLRFGETPADYEEVYVYADPREVKRRFPPRRTYGNNLFVLSPDPHLKRLSEGGVAPLAQIYVDLWQLGRAANRFVDELDRKLELARVGALEAMVRRVRGPKTPLGGRA